MRRLPVSGDLKPQASAASPERHDRRQRGLPHRQRLQHDCDTRRGGRQEQEPAAEAASVLAHEAEHVRQDEAADAADGADDAGHQADFAGEALRHHLEDRAVAEAQAQHQPAMTATMTGSVGSVAQAA